MTIYEYLRLYEDKNAHAERIVAFIQRDNGIMMLATNHNVYEIKDGNISANMSGTNEIYMEVIEPITLTVEDHDWKAVHPGYTRTRLMSRDQAAEMFPSRSLRKINETAE